MRILTAEQSRCIDRAAIEELDIPSLVLMENAALGVVEVVIDDCSAERVAILCGPGNNGGDGLAVARHLVAHGYGVTVAVVGEKSGLSDDARAQLTMLRRFEERCPGLGLGVISSEAELDEWFQELEPPDLLIDALFGTGLTRPLSGLFARAVELAAAIDVPVLAVDVPSGLDADLPEPIGPYLPARWTVTFETAKLVHVLPPGEDLVGTVVVASLGLPEELQSGQSAIPKQAAVTWLDREEVADLRPRRPRAGHKGTFGHLFVIAGSPGKSGAAILAARAASRSGAGLVTVVTPGPCVPLVESGSIESMTLEASTSAVGEIALDALPMVLADDRLDAAVVGPGLGKGSQVADFVRQLVLTLERPLILDADGLGAFAGRVEDLVSRNSGEHGTVLTPHPGELARLLGCPVPTSSTERLARVREAAERSQAVVVLKGYRTLIASPDGEVAICPLGNHGLATGGSGDVLSGMVGAFLAGDLRPWDAARLAVYLHGLAADLYVETGAPESLTATGLVERLSDAFCRLEVQPKAWIDSMGSGRDSFARD